MAEKGNPYKDEKGHYTSKENDGGKCYHNGSSSNNGIDTSFKHEKIFEQKLAKIAKPAQEEAVKRMLGQSEASKFISPEQTQFFKDKFGDNPTPEAISNWLDEQRKKQKEYFDTKVSTLTIKTPEREQLRRQWVDDEIQKQENSRNIKADKIAYFSLGDAGTGKSSAGGKLFKNQYGAIEVDPDIFKTDYIPESKADPNMIGVAHQESSMLADQVYDYAINNGTNIFYPTTGHSLEKLVNKIQKLKDKGYQVYVDYIELDLQENLTRTMTRALGEGRYTNPDVIKRSYGKSKDNFESLIKNYPDLVSGWRLIDNNKGPVVVDEGGKNIFKKEER